MPEVKTKCVYASESLTLSSMTGMLEVLSEYLQNEYVDLQKFTSFLEMDCSVSQGHTHTLNERRKSGVERYRPNRNGKEEEH